MFLEDEILLLAKPLINGSFELFSGKVYFGRMWMLWEEEYALQEFASHDISVVWNLRTMPHNDIGVKEIWSSIEDHGIPEDVNSFLNDVERIVARLKNGENVFVHCFGGRGRTAIGLAALLVKEGATGEEALTKVNSLVKGPETEEQKNFVLGLKN